jgi:hypothetical protein
MTLRLRVVALGCAAAVHLSPMSAQVGGVTGTVSTYGTNTLAWNELLNLSTIRGSCKGSPAICLQSMNRLATAQGVAAITVNIFLDEPLLAADALEYGRLSRAYPVLREIAVDDFVGQYGRLVRNPSVSNPADLLASVVTNVKAASSNLKFGITLYEDEISSPLLQEALLPAGLRAQIDTVHLYLMYRTSAPWFEQYVHAARQIFPRAQIIAGAYAYDRIDYVPCARGGVPCSNEEEAAFFRQAFEIQADLACNGTVAGVEFYPANFGMEDEWSHWNDSRICSALRRQECIDNTRSLRQAALEILRSRGLVSPSTRVLGTPGHKRPLPRRIEPR